MRGITWSWQAVIRGFFFALPALFVITHGDANKGLALAVGVIPGALLGLIPTRKGRFALPLVGLLFAVSILIGSVISNNYITAIGGIFIASFLSAILSARLSIGVTIMTVFIPLVAVGMSYSKFQDGLAMALLIVAGSIYAMCVSLFWPEQTAYKRVRTATLDKKMAVQYGILLGLAAATGTAIGYIFNLEHLGWIPAATLFVMRPQATTQIMRSEGRILSVLAGAFAAALLTFFDPSYGILALFAVLAVVSATATQGSKFYIAPTFTTFIVILLLIYSDATPSSAADRFVERVTETVIGVALAAVFGFLGPKVFAKLKYL